MTTEIARLSDTLPPSLEERDLKYEYLAEKYLRDFVRVLPMTEAEVDRAIQRPGDDFEDSLQYRCATASAVKIIVTRNGGDFVTEGVQSLEPDEFKKMDSLGKTT